MHLLILYERQGISYCLCLQIIKYYFLTHHIHQ